MNSRHHQRGVALLAAILLVAVGTILAATIAFESAMAARRGIASLSFEQAELVAAGAEALAAYGLQNDPARVDDFSEGWAKPFGPTEISPGVMLEASLADLQGRFNLNSLVDKTGTIDKEALAWLKNLLEKLGLEEKWAEQIADWIDADVNPNGAYGLEDGGTTAQVPAYRTANTLITSTSELLALPEFGRERYFKLEPYVTALPPGTKLNVCTAPGQVLDAVVDASYRQYSSDLEQLAKDREKECVPKKGDFDTVLDNERGRGMTPAALTALKNRFDQTSNYFRLTSLASLGGSEFALYSLLKRERVGSGQVKVRVAQRSFTPD